MFFFMYGEDTVHTGKKNLIVCIIEKLVEHSNMARIYTTNQGC